MCNVESGRPELENPLSACLRRLTCELHARSSDEQRLKLPKFGSRANFHEKRRFVAYDEISAQFAANTNRK
jgi:hypothetical protein